MSANTVTDAETNAFLTSKLRNDQAPPSSGTTFTNNTTFETSPNPEHNPTTAATPISATDIPTAKATLTATKELPLTKGVGTGHTITVTSDSIGGGSDSTGGVHNARPRRSSSGFSVRSDDSVSLNDEEREEDAMEVEVMDFDEEPLTRFRSLTAGLALSPAKVGEGGAEDREEYEEDLTLEPVDGDTIETQGTEEGPEDSEGATKMINEWDLCNDTDPEARVAVKAGSVHKWESVLLVLPIMQLEGSLEIIKEGGEYFLTFTPEGVEWDPSVVQAVQLTSSPARDDSSGKEQPRFNSSPGHGHSASPSPPARSLSSPTIGDADASGGESQKKSSRANTVTLEQLKNKAKKLRKWPFRDFVSAYQRRYQLQRTAVEIFLVSGKTHFFNFESKRERNKFLRKLLDRKPDNFLPLFSRSPLDILRKSKLTEKWRKREISNFDYLMHLNTVSGRTYNDLNQYPVFPWVLNNFAAKPSEDSQEAELLDAIAGSHTNPLCPKYFRDLSKPVGALEETRLEQILERFQTFADNDMGGAVQPFHYGSHYSNAGIVLFYLLRLEPFASLHIELQAGRFDFPDRLFSSVMQTWKSCMTSLSCFKELVPELFYMPECLLNINGYDLGEKQDGTRVGDVLLPHWAHHSAQKFVDIQRAALESEYVSANLHHWVDLIFGHKQRGEAASEAHNLFFYLTYEGAVDLDAVNDPVMKEAIKEQIAQFGQTPQRLFVHPHPSRDPLPTEKLVAKKRIMTAQQHHEDPLQQQQVHHLFSFFPLQVPHPNIF